MHVFNIIGCSKKFLEIVSQPNGVGFSRIFERIRNIPIDLFFACRSLIGSNDNKESQPLDANPLKNEEQQTSGLWEKLKLRTLKWALSDLETPYPSELNPFDGDDDEKIDQLNLNPRTKSKKSKKSKKSIRHMYLRVKGEKNITHMYPKVKTEPALSSDDGASLFDIRYLFLEKDSDGYPVEFKPFPRLVFQPLVEGVDPLIIQSQKQSDTLNDDQQAGLDLEAPSPPELNPSSGDKKTQQLDTSSNRRRPQLFTSQKPYWPELKPSSNKKEAPQPNTNLDPSAERYMYLRPESEKSTRYPKGANKPSEKIDQLNSNPFGSVEPRLNFPKLISPKVNPAEQEQSSPLEKIQLSKLVDYGRG